ncbi:MAG: S8 family serine peptidase [Caldilineaceae bacterium]
MNTNKRTGNSHDNLQGVPGIGEVYKDALRACGVNSLADLVRFQPPELVQLLLERAEKKVSLKLVQKWIEEARTKLGTLSSESREQSTIVAAQEPATIVIRKGNPVSKITIQIGGRDVTFAKVPDLFAMRRKPGSAAPRELTESSHVDSIGPERMELFRVADAARMESLVDDLRESPSSTVVTHVYTQDNTPGGEVVPTGTMTIQFADNVSKPQQEEILGRFGLEIIESLYYMPNAFTVHLTPASRENPLKIAAQLQQMPEIKIAEPDISVRVELQYAPNDDLYPQQWHLNNQGGEVGLKAGADVKAEAAWDMTRGKRDIRICIIDDGFDLTHPEFDHPGKIVAPRDFGEDDFDPNPVFGDDNHGTACAGVALAEEDGQGVVGLAPQCAFMPVRMSNWFSADTIASYFQYAIENDADVISCSWHASAWYYPLPQKVDAIIRYAATQGRQNKKGCVILFAAGNQGRPLDGEQDGTPSVQGFALHPNVIAVGASTSMDLHAPYSNHGPELALCAPSSSEGTVGWSIVTTDRRGIRGYTAGDYTRGFGGTSSATPLAAGLAALILSVNPELTSAEVKSIMMDTADKIDPANGHYDGNGHSRLFGHGRINAWKAVQRALEVAGHQLPTNDEHEESAFAVEISNFALSQIVPESGSTPRRLLAQIQFAISSDESSTSMPPGVYASELILINDHTGSSDIVASETKSLHPTQSAYASEFEFQIPAMGRYQTEGRVTIILDTGKRIATKLAGQSLRVL